MGAHTPRSASIFPSVDGKEARMDVDKIDEAVETMRGAAQALVLMAEHNSDTELCLTLASALFRAADLADPRK